MSKDARASNCHGVPRTVGARFGAADFRHKFSFFAP
jgi:hypothetical protein